MRATPVSPRAPRAPRIVLGVLSAVAVTVVFIVAVTSESGQRWEDTALTAADYPGTWFGLLNLVSIPTIAAVSILAVVIALLRRRPGLAARAIVIVGVSTLAGQLLKHGLLDRPDISSVSADNSFPSGHTIAVVSLWFALATVLPPLGRRLVLLVAVPFTAAVCAQLIGYGWHRLSDVIGGILIVVTAAAIAGALWPDTAADRTVTAADRVLRVALQAVVAVAAVLALVLFLVYRGGQEYQASLLLLSCQLLAVSVAAAGFLVTFVPWRTPRTPPRARPDVASAQDPVLSGR
ncbi:phosphatase PAP2 family protein [Mycetocola reblochoni]|uniref:Phosphoesterase, PA-phosphatase related n=2 Tax=Mycetocola reblochoni TaxID=331618 RepID=A0A1R4IKU6_9MICO|nr:phosphatase PAP2 family protein [Mycetocola reblochoni]RLP70136.1 phosphatase PAP2 family protein [Mycetocola reblochoni]SJN20500.1 phosphoesterase, PA-phosphatase related [Mycetocola reblochoni REB411]